MQMKALKGGSLFAGTVRLCLMLALMIKPPDLARDSWMNFDSTLLRRLGHIHCYQKDYGCDINLLECYYFPEACPAANLCVAGSGAGFY